MTRIKICGITRIQDALFAARAGADAIGLVFYPASPRNVGVARAQEILAALPPFITSVGLFVNAGANDVHAILRELRLDLLQFHGDEDAEFCRQFNKPYMKAVRVRPGVDLLQYAAEHRTAKALLLDTYRDEAYGGTGHTFDWKLIPQNLSMPVVLSGGLNTANVGRGIQSVRPWAVDVSSGVEADKGIKESAKITAFIQAVRSADKDVI
ncbi:MAG: phosphoribosylanthranilate isomerase [Burkholderiales bacterium]